MNRTFLKEHFDVELTHRNRSHFDSFFIFLSKFENYLETNLFMFTRRDISMEQFDDSFVKFKVQLDHKSLSFIQRFRFHRKVSFYHHVLKTCICAWKVIKVKNDCSWLVRLHVESSTPAYILHIVRRIFVLLSHRSCEGKLVDA